MSDLPLERLRALWADKTAMHDWFSNDPRVVVVGTRKGGTGKTRTSIELASFFAGLGLRTAYVATDPNANGIMCFGLGDARYTGEAGRGMHDALIEGGIWIPLDVEPELKRANLDIFGAGSWTRLARDKLTASRVMPPPEEGDLPHFADVLMDLQKRYQVIVVDTGADFASETEKDTLECADILVAPTNDLAIELSGVVGTADTIAEWFEVNEVQDDPPPVVALLAIVSRSAIRLEAEARDLLRDSNIRCFETRIGTSKFDVDSLITTGETAFDRHSDISYVDDLGSSEAPGFTTKLHRELTELGIEVLEILFHNTNQGAK